MSSTLNFTTTIVADHYLITGSLAAGATLPAEVFIYTNVGDGTLGEFFGTCNVQELGSLAKFTAGVAQPTFGNKYLRHSQVKIVLPLEQDPVSVISTIVKNVTSLSKAYASQATVASSFTIP